MSKDPFATTRRDEDQPQGPLVGFLTTRVLTAEREPLFAAQGGVTPGALIDQRIDDMREQFRRIKADVPDTPSPELHSITFEFPVE